MSDLKDPRVLFAAERTLLAWNRTSISLMAFGFAVERFGLFLQIAEKVETRIYQRHLSFFVGVSFVLLATFMAIYSVWQHKRILKTIKSVEIPQGYNTNIGMITNGILGALGITLIIYLTRSFI